MKRGKWFIALLSVSLACVANMSVAATVQSKSAKKNVAVSHKTNKTIKTNKTVHKTSVTRQRQMSEKDITECVRLIDKVAQTDKVLQTGMSITVTNNNKIAEHLKRPADAQVFASDDPAAIAHLTGKTANLPIVKAPPIAATLVAPKPITAKLAPPPAFKPTTATLVAPSKVVKPITKQPHHTQVFASDDPKVLANLMGKTTALPVTPTTTKFATTPPVAKVYKPIKPTTAHPHPHIELFAPNPLVDLNHLEGKSANLTTLEKTVPADKSTTQKTKKSTHKSKSSSSSAVTTDTKAKTKTKKEHS
jgi:hypothetical protein